eukprot:1975089-Amphidinium_carterae.1
MSQPCPHLSEELQGPKAARARLATLQGHHPGTSHSHRNNAKTLTHSTAQKLKPFGEFLVFAAVLAVLTRKYVHNGLCHNNTLRRATTAIQSDSESMSKMAKNVAKFTNMLQTPSN